MKLFFKKYLTLVSEYCSIKKRGVWKINPILCPIAFYSFKEVHIFVDVKHKLCEHKDRANKMQRLYKRDKGRFIPVGWMCPDCLQMRKD